MDDAPEPKKNNKNLIIAGLTVVLSLITHGLQFFGGDAVRLAGSRSLKAPASVMADQGEVLADRVVSTAVRIGTFGRKVQKMGTLDAAEGEPDAAAFQRFAFLKRVQSVGLQRYLAGKPDGSARDTADSFSRVGQADIANIIYRALRLSADAPQWKELEVETAAWAAQQTP